MLKIRGGVSFYELKSNRLGVNVPSGVNEQSRQRARDDVVAALAVFFKFYIHISIHFKVYGSYKLTATLRKSWCSISKTHK